MRGLSGPADTGRRHGNVSNPRIGSRMQQACESHATVKGSEKFGKFRTSGGGNRRGRAKRRGRNAGAAAAAPREGGNTLGRRTPGMRSMKGTGARAPTNPRRGGRRESTGADRPGRWRHLLVHERSEAHEGRAPATRPRGQRAGDGDQRGNLEGPAERSARTNEARGRQTTRYLTIIWSTTLFA